jgi:hypothetical protein
MEGKTMAKDKSKKADTKPAKGGASNDDDFAKPSEAPAGGDGWKLADQANIGKLMLFTPLRTDSVHVARGKKGEDVDVIVADVDVLNEKKPEKSEEHEEVFVFGKWVQGALRGFIGERKVLGRLEQDAGKSQGDRPAWVLEDADADDIKVARAYLDQLDPFKGAGKKKAKK